MISSAKTKQRIWLATAVFAVALGLRLFQLSAAGNVWDEYFYYDATRDYARSLISLDFRPEAWKANYEHPPLGKYTYLPAIALNHVIHPNDRDAYDAPRAMSAIIGSFTVALLFWFGARLYSTRVGLTAAAIYGLMPALFAYHRIIDLDVTLILWWTIAMGGFLLWQEHHDERTLWWTIVAASLAIASKFNAILITIPLYGAVLLDQWSALSKSRKLVVPRPLLFFPLVVALILFSLWPWLWSNPISQFSATIGHWGGVVRELYFGQFTTPGAEYFIVHFLAGTPLVALALIAMGIWQRRTYRDRRYWTLALFLIAPFGISFFHLRQDHLRYVLTAYSAGALLAAIGLDRIIGWLQSRWGVPALVPIGITLGSLVWSLAWIHPYYLNYYNPLAGGTKGVVAHQRFEIGFYGEGIREATDYINHTAPNGATVHYEVIPDDAPYLDRPRLIRQDVPPGADYLITNTNAMNSPAKRSHFSLEGYHIVYEVQAAGAPFVWVYRRDQL